jgi:hypothetical protein
MGSDIAHPAGADLTKGLATARWAQAVVVR